MLFYRRCPVSAGQRELSMPGVREGISEQLLGAQGTTAPAAYLTAARTDARVVNHLARRLVESKGAAMPAAPLAAPSRSSARQRFAMDKRNAAISWSLRTSRTSPTSTG